MFGCFPRTFKQFSKFQLLLSRDFPGTFQGLSRDFPGTFQGLSRNCLGSFQGLSREFPGNFQGISRDFPGTFQGLFRDFPETLQGLSSDFPGTFQRLSSLFPVTFQTISRYFPDTFRYFPGTLCTSTFPFKPDNYFDLRSDGVALQVLSRYFLWYFSGSFQALLNSAFPLPHLTQASIPIRGAMALQVKKAHISVRCCYSFYQALLF